MSNFIIVGTNVRVGQQFVGQMSEWDKYQWEKCRGWPNICGINVSGTYVSGTKVAPPFKIVSLRGVNSSKKTCPKSQEGLVFENNIFKVERGIITIYRPNLNYPNLT
jgi:hypothetical protein